MINDEFLRDLICSIEKTANEGTHIPSKSYKPSSMNCIRNMFFQIEGREPEPSTSAYTSVGILETGTDRHLRIQNAVAAMRANGFDCDYIDIPTYLSEHPELSNIQIIKSMGVETLLHNVDLNMNFACDGIIRYKGNYYIVEFKTEGSYKFDLRTSVDPSHFNQASAYALSFNINNVLFIYIDRNTLKMKSYLLQVTDTMKERISSKIELCNIYISRGVIPPKDPVDYKTCAWCGYREFCKSIPKEEFDIREFSSERI